MRADAPSDIHMMCGRYGLSAPGRVPELGLPDALTVEVQGAEPRWNITPSEAVHAVVADRDGVRPERLRWGLIPFWAKDADIGRRLANARAESVRTKPSFRRAFAAHRAIVFADLFYEWQVQPGQRTKQPWCVRRPNGGPVIFAALWDRWSPPEDRAATLATCTLITTSANDVMAPIHARMPVLLSPDDAMTWLDMGTAADALEALLRPADASLLTAYPVSTWVNSPSHDDARCAEPLEGLPDGATSVLRP